MLTAPRQSNIESPANVSPGVAAFNKIIEQHAIDAAFLWLLRSQAVDGSTLYTQEDINELDQRLAGHLEGLVSAGYLGWEICLQQLDFEEAGETFVAAVIAFQSGDDAKIKIICEAGLANPEMTIGLVSALGWIDKTTALHWIDRFLRVSNQKYRYLGIAACSIRRFDPKQHLTDILQDESISTHPQLYARALRLIGEIKRVDLIPALNQAMEDKDKTVSFWANWSSVLLGNELAVNNLKLNVLEENAHQDQALELVFSVLTVDQAKHWISEISADPSQNRTVIKSIGILGDPQAVPWLVQQMNNLLFARLAGRSFSLITGIDLEQHKLDKEIEVTFEDNPDADIEDDAENADIDLPWPDPENIQTFWDQHGNFLQAGQCYFLGQSITIESLKQVLQTGNQLQRNNAALKLAMLESNSILLNTAISTVLV